MRINSTLIGNHKTVNLRSVVGLKNETQHTQLALVRELGFAPRNPTYEFS
jgi:hypothetical protein